MKVFKLPPETLQPKLDEVQASGDWVPRYLSGLKAVINKNPLRYREYGPYWWLLKKALIDSGDLTFGDEIDREWFDILSYGSVEMNIAAAIAYEESRDAGQCNIYDERHTLETEEGEPYEYVIADSDIESILRHLV